MFRPSLIAALSLFTLATLPLAAEQQAGSAATTARRTVSKTTVAKAKEQALTTIQGNALNSTNGQHERRGRPAARCAVRPDRRYPAHRQVGDVHVQGRSIRAPTSSRCMAQRRVDRGGEPDAQRQRRRGRFGGRQAAVSDSVPSARICRSRNQHARRRLLLATRRRRAASRRSCRRRPSARIE